MVPQEVITLALEIVLAIERQKKTLMEESLRANQLALQKKVRERSMLKRKNQDMLAKEAAKKKLLDDCMAFIGASENNENAQNFDEKAMMKAIETMMNSDGGDKGGFAGSYGDTCVPGINLGLERKTTIDESVAVVNKVASCGCHNGGFFDDHGEINDASDNAQNLGEEDKKAAVDETNGDNDESNNAGGYGGSYNGNRRK
ncbi:uncharacterized protein LOC111295451 [Durio zibethinus]|uniref:Uncharacterized protein LOC111295451 n=1 Tax=Durio zibethinus TaxID=66656 RepID=A0A6P5YWZ3_DURZI|nr:uncharacterized protein LOC111295451 [Durio zibethinus]